MVGTLHALDGIHLLDICAGRAVKKAVVVTLTYCHLDCILISATSPGVCYLSSMLFDRCINFGLSLFQSNESYILYLTHDPHVSFHDLLLKL